MRARVGVLVVSAALGVHGSVLASPPASITAVGWWSQRPGASKLPDGGFEISLAPTGPVSEAALRVKVNAVQLTTALLELTESQAYGAEVASVHACPTNDRWTPANPGSWSDAPTPNCTGQKDIALSRRETGDWTADVTSLLHLGVVSIVLVPRSDPDVQGAPIPYQLTFARARLVATAPSAPTPNATTNQPNGSSPSGPIVVAAPAQPPSGVGPAPPPIAVAPERVDVPPATAPPFAETNNVDTGSSRPWWRLVFLMPISVAAALVAAVVRRRLAERG